MCMCMQEIVFKNPNQFFDKNTFDQMLFFMEGMYIMSLRIKRITSNKTLKRFSIDISKKYCNELTNSNNVGSNLHMKKMLYYNII